MTGLLYLVICFAVGMIAGMIFLYLVKRHNSVGTLHIYKNAQTSELVLELEKDISFLEKEKIIRLRVNNTLYYE